MKPYSPNRLKLSVIGLFVGLVLGAAVSVGAEMVDDRLYSEKEVKELLPVAIISEIPEIKTAREGKRKLRFAVLGWAAMGLEFVLILAGCVVSYIRG